jgi:hypothetical protein
MGTTALAKPDKVHSVGNIAAARSPYGFVMFEDRMASRNPTRLEYRRHMEAVAVDLARLLLSHHLAK